MRVRLYGVWTPELQYSCTITCIVGRPVAPTVAQRRRGVVRAAPVIRSWAIAVCVCVNCMIYLYIS